MSNKSHIFGYLLGLLIFVHSGFDVAGVRKTLAIRA